MKFYPGRIIASVVLVAWSQAAPAVRAPPDYREQITGQMAARASLLNASGSFDVALAFAERYLESVEIAPEVAYEAGYACYRMGDLSCALRHYDLTLSLDADMTTAHYDRGEVLLSLGRLDAARRDFQAVVVQRPDHWAGHFRLAELAGHAGDSRSFEAHLIAAIRLGFDFRTIERDPAWRKWARDATLGSVLRKLMVLYSDETILQRMQQDP